MGSLELSLPEKLVELRVERVDHVPSLFCLCILYWEALATAFQEKETVPPPVGFVSEWLMIVGAAQLIGVGVDVGVGVSVGVSVAVGVAVGVGVIVPLATLA